MTIHIERDLNNIPGKKVDTYDLNYVMCSLVS